MEHSSLTDRFRGVTVVVSAVGHQWGRVRAALAGPASGGSSLGGGESTAGCGIIGLSNVASSDVASPDVASSGVASSGVASSDVARTSAAGAPIRLGEIRNPSEAGSLSGGSGEFEGNDIRFCDGVYEGLATVVKLERDGGKAVVCVMVDYLAESEMSIFRCLCSMPGVCSVAFSVFGRVAKLSCACRFGAQRTATLDSLRHVVRAGVAELANRSEQATKSEMATESEMAAESEMTAKSEMTAESQMAAESEMVAESEQGVMSEPAAGPEVSHCDVAAGHGVEPPCEPGKVGEHAEDDSVMVKRAAVRRVGPSEVLDLIDPGDLVRLDVAKKDRPARAVAQSGNESIRPGGDLTSEELDALLG